MSSAVAGAAHIADRNFQAVIDRAMALPGFEDDLDKGEAAVGFARNAVLGVADLLIANRIAGNVIRQNDNCIGHRQPTGRTEGAVQRQRPQIRLCCCSDCFDYSLYVINPLKINSIPHFVEHMDNLEYSRVHLQHPGIESVGDSRITAHR